MGPWLVPAYRGVRLGTTRLFFDSLITQDESRAPRAVRGNCQSLGHRGTDCRRFRRPATRTTGIDPHSEMKRLLPPPPELTDFFKSAPRLLCTHNKTQLYVIKLGCFME